MTHQAQNQTADARLRLEDAIAQATGLADTLMQLDLEKADRISTPSFHRTAWALSSMLHQAGDDLATVLKAGAPAVASIEPNRTTEVPITGRQRTARLTDKADEAEAGIRELLAALDMAVEADVDSATSRHAVRGFAKLARDAYERAAEAARIAEELHEGNQRDRAAGGLES